MILYHGSYEREPFEIKNISPGYVDFGGIFASSSYDAAASHGEHVFELDVPEGEILETFHLAYEIELERTLEAIEKTFWRALSEEELDIFWDSVIEEKEVDEDDLCNLLEIKDFAEARWECQRLRGQVARHLGYQAVEMKDEHGTSYLVLPGVTLRCTD